MSNIDIYLVDRVRPAKISLGKIFPVLALFLAFAQITRTQTSTGEILGSITDISGASVPGARVTVTNEGTNLQSPITSNAAGEYVAPFLQPGPYSVIVEMQGFQRQIRRGLI